MRRHRQRPACSLLCQAALVAAELKGAAALALISLFAFYKLWRRKLPRYGGSVSTGRPTPLQPQDRRHTHTHTQQVEEYYMCMWSREHRGTYMYGTCSQKYKSNMDVFPGQNCDINTTEGGRLEADTRLMESGISPRTPSASFTRRG